MGHCVFFPVLARESILAILRIKRALFLVGQDLLEIISLMLGSPSLFFPAGLPSEPVPGSELRKPVDRQLHGAVIG
jgi:hypothetical protein